MPTAGRLFGAVTFGILFYFVSEQIKPLLDEGTQDELLSPINAAFGFLMGWRMIGSRAGEGMGHSLGYGLTTSAAGIFWCLFAWAGYEMYQQAIRMRYDGPVHALQEMVILMVEYARFLIDPVVLISMVGGTLVATWITEFFASRWS